MYTVMPVPEGEEPSAEGRPDTQMVIGRSENCSGMTRLLQEQDPRKPIGIDCKDGTRGGDRGFCS